jgi:septal ring factor EnvC (AmiA/AmiB activator)
MNLNDYNSQDLIKSLEAEAAKAMAELKTAQNDLDKINSRLRFILVVIHILKDREINSL